MLRFFILGLLFGVVLLKSQIISWYRIIEMFRFESFHMYGIIGSAVIVGILGNLIIKKRSVKDIHDEPIQFAAKEMSIARYLIGGTLFGLGWALVGSCPGPIVALIGYGYVSFIVVLIGAIIGTWSYGMLRSRLPH